MKKKSDIGESNLGDALEVKACNDIAEQVKTLMEEFGQHYDRISDDNPFKAAMFVAMVFGTPEKKLGTIAVGNKINTMGAVEHLVLQLKAKTVLDFLRTDLMGMVAASQLLGSKDGIETVERIIKDME